MESEACAIDMVFRHLVFRKQNFKEIQLVDAKKM